MARNGKAGIIYGKRCVLAIEKRMMIETAVISGARIDLHTRDALIGRTNSNDINNIIVPMSTVDQILA